MCFIFSSLLLPAENLHYRQVVLLKGNLMVVVERGKRVCYSLPSQRHVPSGPSSETLARTPHSRLYSAVTVHTSVTDGWDIICGYVIFFFFFEILFKDISWRGETMERRTRSSPPCVCQDICRSRLCRAAYTQVHVQDVSSSPG